MSNNNGSKNQPAKTPPVDKNQGPPPTPTYGAGNAGATGVQTRSKGKPYEAEVHRLLNILTQAQTITPEQREVLEAIPTPEKVFVDRSEYQDALTEITAEKESLKLAQQELIKKQEKLEERQQKNQEAHQATLTRLNIREKELQEDRKLWETQQQTDEQNFRARTNAFESELAQRRAKQEERAEAVEASLHDRVVKLAEEEQRLQKQQESIEQKAAEITEVRRQLRLDEVFTDEDGNAVTLLETVQKGKHKFCFRQQKNICQKQKKAI